MDIRFENVSKAYERRVFENRTLRFSDGKITALLGESGRGKTTALRLIAGLERPDAGTVQVRGKVAYLFQEPRLLPAVSVWKNVRLAAKSDEAAQAALKLCRAEHFADKLPDTLSGGEKQRAALARFFVCGGDILLLDEPFSALDAETKDAVIQNLLPYFRKKTTVLVTHSQAEAARLADETIRL